MRRLLDRIANDVPKSRDLLAYAQRRHVQRGHYLTRQGVAADAIYFLISGRSEVLIEGVQEPIAEVGVGDAPIVL